MQQCTASLTAGNCCHASLSPLCTWVALLHCRLLSKAALHTGWAYAEVLSNGQRPASMQLALTLLVTGRHS